MGVLGGFWGHREALVVVGDELGQEGVGASSSPSIPPESSAAISPAVTAAASTRSKARAAATASVAPPSPSVKASTAPISLLCRGKILDYRVLAQGQPPIPTDDEKSLCRTVDKARSLQRKRPRYKPSPDHPWNRWARLHPAPSTPAP